MGESEAAAVASEALKLGEETHNQSRSPKGVPQQTVQMVDPIDKYSAFIVRFAKFEHVSQIPKDFIRKELELKGKIREVLPDGALKVEHEPIIKIPFLNRKSKNVGLLKMRLAGVELSKAGQQFITKDLRIDNKPVIFTVIKGSEQSPDEIDAEITLKKNSFSRTNLNLEVVRRGYARVPAVEDPKHLKALQTVPPYARLISRLLLSEKVADRRGIGVWERDTWVESVQSLPSQVLLFNVTRDIIIYGVKFTQQAYAVALIMAGYIASGYRKFAVGVDRITNKYNQVRQRLHKS
ncbi:hypothetical protein WR25_27243 [Diploscapter pachys]|uniref:TNase-like domain-containing protein n=1 Tax=Diploscapter pachys TaxID=2018661 RepID=A0A2A2LD11_9BILA|nr:hypothetical protein WR25_27243 [Diploscapter pachys]